MSQLDEMCTCPRSFVYSNWQDLEQKLSVSCVFIQCLVSLLQCPVSLYSVLYLYNNSAPCLNIVPCVLKKCPLIIVPCVLKKCPLIIVPRVLKECPLYSALCLKIIYIVARVL